MTIERFTKRAGDTVAHGTDDSRMTVVGDVRPDFVALPANLGGGTARVTGASLEPCPRDGSHNAWTLAVTHGRVTHVAECPEHGGFLWYRRSAE